MRTVTVGLVTMLGLGVMAPQAGAATGDVTEFSIPTASSAPQGIAVGFDGALWFTERSSNAIGRLADGVFTEYPLPNVNSAPYWITAGPDGNLWFTERSQTSENRIGRITNSGVITEFPIPTPMSQPGVITTGPDGALWFAEQAGNRIGRITAQGEVTEFPLPPGTAPSGPFGITVGPDGNLWFTELTASRIGRMTTGGAVTEFQLPLGRSPSDITLGGDGNLWFTERTGNKIGRISVGGTLEEFLINPAASTGPMGLALGPDGNVWFTESNASANKVGLITPDGTITGYPLPNPGSQPFAITRGVDGAMWFTESSGNRVGRIDVAAAPAPPAPPPDTTAPSVTITSPAEGSGFSVGQVVAASYSCSDETGGSGIATCVGAVSNGSAIDTSLGTHTFSVTGTDVAGNPTVSATSYKVSPPPDTTAPSVTITSPAEGSVYSVGQVLPAAYACSDETGGSGIATCVGPVSNGSAIDTSLGTHAFTVTATDVAGNPTVRTTSYAVLGYVGGRLKPFPAWNEARAGSELPVWFDLGPALGTAGHSQRPSGDHGNRDDRPPAGLFAAGFPITRAVDCGDLVTAIGPAEAPNVEVHLSRGGRLQLEWKSDRRWAGGCRTLTLRFDIAGWRDAAIVFLVRFR
jgi:streptogramin lyase